MTTSQTTQPHTHADEFATNIEYRSRTASAGTGAYDAMTEHHYVIKTNSSVSIGHYGIKVNHSDVRVDTAHGRAAEFDRPHRIAQAHRFIENLKCLSRQGAVDEGIDKVIEAIDFWLTAAELTTCQLALQFADPAALDIAISLSLLSMTVVEKDTLNPFRLAFYERLKTVLAESRPENEVAMLLHDLV